MGECQATRKVLQGEEDLIAAAHNIVNALEMNKNLTSDARQILADLGSRLSALARECDIKEEESPCEIEELLNSLQLKVMRWDLGQSSMIWDCAPEEGYEYLKAVNDACKLEKMLEDLSVNQDDEEDGLLQKARNIIQTAMLRLEKEFRHLLVQERMSFCSNGYGTLVDGSFNSSSDDSTIDVFLNGQSFEEERRSEDYIVELMHPEVIHDLKSIANLMFDSNYGETCSEAYITVGKGAVDNFLYILEVEKLSIEGVPKFDLCTFKSKVRRWTSAMKIFVRACLASEKRLSDQIFGDLESVSSMCFSRLSKASTLQLLNFAEEIAIGPHQPEKLIQILDMYEVLSDLINDIDALYVGDTVSSVRMEFQDMLRRLGKCAKATFVEFQNAVASSRSSIPCPGGGIHPLTRYVMNYLTDLMEYSKTLDVLLKDNDEEDLVSTSPDRSPSNEDDTAAEISSASLVALHFKPLLLILESNLEEKSKLYKDDALRHLFLMNNVHHMAEKVKNSELRTILGGDCDWLRKQMCKFQQHAISYQRATWSFILSLLKNDGLQNPGSNSYSKTLLKERLQSFNLAFEGIYKSQTAWCIPDYQLREDLRITTSPKVIHAYRVFVKRHIYNHVSDKHFKYSADDLETFLFDFFEGSPRSLHGHKKK